MDLPEGHGDLPPAIKLGDSVEDETVWEGTITAVADGEIIKPRYDNKGDEASMFVVLNDEETLWFVTKKFMGKNERPDFLCQALADAAKEATGSPRLEVGGELKVKRLTDKVFDAGPARQYKAKYTAPKGGASLPDEDDSGF